MSVEAVGECVICLDADASHLVVPCGHQCLCAACASSVQQCPCCRGPIVQCIRVFASGHCASKPHKVKKDKKKEKKRKKDDAADEIDGRSKSARGIDNVAVTGSQPISRAANHTMAASLPNSNSIRVGENGDQETSMLQEIEALRAVLESHGSTDHVIQVALERLAALLPVPSEQILRQTNIGRAMQSFSQGGGSRAASEPLRQRARNLVLSWKDAVRAERRRIPADTTSHPVETSLETGSEQQGGSATARGSLEVLEVKVGRIARARIARHTAKARLDIAHSIEIDDCIEVDGDGDDGIPAESDSDVECLIPNEDS